jgi:hypothetical protein
MDDTEKKVMAEKVSDILSNFKEYIGLTHKIMDKMQSLGKENKRLKKALMPFAHKDLSDIYKDYKEGAGSYVFEYGDAVLKIEDFKRARSCFKG